MSLSVYEQCIHQLVGEALSRELFRSLDIKPALFEAGKNKAQDSLSQAQLAMLLTMLLFKDLVDRVPEARVYRDERINASQKIRFDHGALRTVAIDMRSLPKGQAAFSRILEPLGYDMVGEYPLAKLKMSGFVYRHKDFPEAIPQYFVSELYPEKFSAEFQQTVSDIVYDSVEPLSNEAKCLLNTLQAKHYLDLASAVDLLKVLPQCFTRQHDIPSMEQYKKLLAESAEMAWIATEGNAFNHATDRVNNLDLLEDEERGKGRHMKAQIEEGKNANIRQTAYRASEVVRVFKTESGLIKRQVPGSFFEFIERGNIIDPGSGKAKMDLRFDSKNAQGIFKMTEQTKD